MTCYAGFDTKDYPTLPMMNWLKANSNLSWCACYLAPAPNHPDRSWQNTYPELCDSWGVVAVYVGQQDKRTSTGNYTPSSILTALQGDTDANDAIRLASGDRFPAGSVIYLDWEYGAIDGSGAVDYILAWVRGIVSDGTMTPGIYCSHDTAAAIAAELAKLTPAASVRFWCWKVADANNHRFDGNLAALPTPSPADCGFAQASIWQREQNALVCLPAGAPLATLEMDFSTANAANPGLPPNGCP